MLLKYNVANVLMVCQLLNSELLNVGNLSLLSSVKTVRKDEALAQAEYAMLG